jgi:RNA polymerase sigma factor (sigma-70 family)
MKESNLHTENERLRIQACLNGDAQSQSELYHQFAGKLYAICLRYMGEPDSARDNLQETWIKIFTKLGEYKAQGSFEGWLRRIAVTTCLDSIKSDRMRFSTDIEEHATLRDEAPSLDSRLDADRLLKLIEQLPVGYRVVFNLFAIEGYGHSEIAALLNISENTSKSQLFKARKWLQERLVDEKK